MNKAASIPYHLRVNKTIDRNLFVDLLKYIERQFDLKSYVYIGMGGPFLEDFKLFHSNFIFKDMISIESDPNTAERQEFNRPFSCMQIENTSSGDFITKYGFNDPTIIWFDYTSFNIYEQLNEITSLISNLGPGDVLKVTINANVNNLDNIIESQCGTCSSSGLDIREKEQARQDTFQQLMREFEPTNLKNGDFSSSKFSSTLLRCLRIACERGMKGKQDLHFQPLSAFDYADGQKMLSACGILLHTTEDGEFMSKTGIDKWPEKSLSWDKPVPISVPELSIKERLTIESMLPGADINQIITKFPFIISGDTKETESQISNFVRYYRQYPHYSRIWY